MRLFPGHASDLKTGPPVVTLPGLPCQGPGVIGSVLGLVGPVRLFPGHTSDLKTGPPVATLPGAWCHRVSAGTGWPGETFSGSYQ